jgi:dienelactone hydrolase
VSPPRIGHLIDGQLIRRNAMIHHQSVEPSIMLYGRSDQSLRRLGLIQFRRNRKAAKVFIGWLDQQPSVAKDRKMIGTQGYCMGGPIAFRTAAAVPDRVGAVASLHGGGLVTKTSNSPHLQAAKSKAQFLIAIAASDDERASDDKNVLKETFEKANLPAEIEVYTGAAHGWCPPGSRVYNDSTG